MSTTSLDPMHMAGQFDHPDQQRAAATTGMWIFLVSETLFFGALFFAYVVCRLRMPEAFAAASGETDVVLGSINTAVLITSSFTMALAVQSQHAGTRRATPWLLLATACLGLAFLAIKGIEYRAEFERGLFPGAGFHFEPPAMAANAQAFWFLYFVMTGLHALHLLIGISLVLYTAWRLRMRSASPPGPDWVSGTGLYWHLVDVVWIFVFPMLYLVSRAS